MNTSIARQQRHSLLWSGHETAERIRTLIAPATVIDVQLPGEYHHALFQALYPTAPPGEPEIIDASGDPVLLGRITAINGLEDLQDLIASLTEAGATVRISGRAKITITIA
jgi:hypothetical protein